MIIERRILSAYENIISSHSMQTNYSMTGLCFLASADVLFRLVQFTVETNRAIEFGRFQGKHRKTTDLLLSAVIIIIVILYAV
jgi:hypothetical protein